MYTTIYIYGGCAFSGPQTQQQVCKETLLKTPLVLHASDCRWSMFKAERAFFMIYYHQTSRKHHADKNGSETSIHIYIYRYLSTYRYVLWKSCWLQVLCVYGKYPSLHIRQHETTRTWKQTRQTAETIQFGRNMPKHGHICYEILYCIEPMNIRDKF